MLAVNPVCLSPVFNSKESLAMLPLQKKLLKKIDYYSDKACYSYWDLAKTLPMGGEIKLLNGSTMTQHQLYSKYILLASNPSPYAYATLAYSLSKIGATILLKGRIMNSQQLYCEAIHINPKYAEPYYNLAADLPEGEKITLLNGKVMSKEDLYKKAIKLDLSLSLEPE